MQMIMLVRMPLYSPNIIKLFKSVPPLFHIIVCIDYKTSMTTLSILTYVSTQSFENAHGDRICLHKGGCMCVCMSIYICMLKKISKFANIITMHA